MLYHYELNDISGQWLSQRPKISPFFTLPHLNQTSPEIYILMATIQFSFAPTQAAMSIAPTSGSISD